MIGASRRKRSVDAGRLSTCALGTCRRLFAVCGPCDRGRRYCSPDCARASRGGQLRRAGQRYQATERGRLAHAARQARYRERRTRVTHRSGQGHRRGAQARAHAGPVEPDGFATPSCVRCGGSSGFLRNGFRMRSTRRSVAKKVASCSSLNASEALGAAVPAGGPQGIGARAAATGIRAHTGRAPTRPERPDALAPELSSPA